MMEALSEARELGAMLAWSHNKEAETDVVGAIDYARRADYRERAESLANVYGPAVDEAFAQGYDAAIDFSCNADWRLAKTDSRLESIQVKQAGAVETQAERQAGDGGQGQW